MNKKLLVFNWKSAPATVSAAIKLTKTIENSIPQKNAPEIVIAPPFLFIEEIGKFIKKAKLGSQDVFWKNIGPYTGEISLRQEKNLKVKYVIIGHSERRRILGETDTMINKKVLAALKSGLKVILCIGENLTIRKRGEKTIENFIKSQLQKDLKNIENCKLKIENLVIAYEPIWAIGTGQADTPEDAVEIIKYIKKVIISKYKVVKIKTLYGGSIDGKNIKDFLQYKEMDGFLVGGASLKNKEFKKIIYEVGKINS
ncbi:MAG: triose-phosphate isomerase [Patescibacteria group bacterium]